MNRLYVYILGAIIALGASFAAFSHISSAFTERDELAKKVTLLDERIKTLGAEINLAKAERDLARTEAIVAAEQAKAEQALRSAIAIAAAKEKQKHRESLDHALDQIRRIGESSAAYRDCMRLPLAAGVLPAPEAGPTSQVAGYPRDAADGIPATDSGASYSRTVGDGLILGQQLQTAFRACESDKTALRAWVAGQGEGGWRE